jgi:hypothetical protein
MSFLYCKAVSKALLLFVCAQIACIFHVILLGVMGAAGSAHESVYRSPQSSPLPWRQRQHHHILFSGAAWRHSVIIHLRRRCLAYI